MRTKVLISIILGVILCLSLAALCAAQGQTTDLVSESRESRTKPLAEATATVRQEGVPTPIASEGAVEDTLLYTGLTWKALGAHTADVYIGNERSVEMSGTAYQSESADYAQGKLPAEVATFYSFERLSFIGWQWVGGAPRFGGTTETYFKAPNRYLIVEIASDYASESYDAIVDTGSDGYHVTAWISLPDQEVPTPITYAPKPGVEAPSLPMYSNPLPVPFLGQRWDPWGGDIQGWGDAGYPSACNSGFVRDNGCWTTSYAMLYNYYQSSYTNPRDLNSKLNTGPSPQPMYTASCGGPAHCNSCMPERACAAHPAASTSTLNGIAPARAG